MAARLLILLLLGVTVLTTVGCQQSQIPATEVVTITGETFDLELAVDVATTTRGLMDRQDIAADGGMLFVFPTVTVRQFWMGYCVVDIDILFLDSMGRVTATHRMKAEAPRRDGESETLYRSRLRDYSSVYPAQFAIELRAGSLDRLGINVDDKIELDYDRLKGLTK